MQDINFLYKSWKLLLVSGVLGLLLSTILILLMLYKLTPYFLSIHQKRLRDQNDEPVPKIGGIGIMGSFFLTLLLLWFIPFDTQMTEFEITNNNRILSFTIGGMFAWSLGFIDDLLQIRARWKLGGQLVLAFFAIYTGFAIDNLQGPFFQEISLGLWSWPVTILWIVTVMNAVNLIDGLDGLAGGIVLTVLTTLGVISWWNGIFPLLLIIIALFGATLGFLLFNRSPAMTFMGDSGSQFLGYVIALLSIWATETSEGKQSMLPILILALPLLDTFFAFTRRLVKGIPFYSADKDHLHHRLVARGVSPAKAVAILVILSSVFSLLALVVVFNSYLQGFSYIIGFLVCFFILYFLEYDLLRKPIIALQSQNVSRKRRDLMIALAEQMEDYLSKDEDIKSVFHSFRYWCSLAGISQFQVFLHGKIYENPETFEESLRIIIFKFNIWEIHLGLPQESWTIDSDVKAGLMEKASESFSRRLQQLESPKVVEIKR